MHDDRVALGDLLEDIAGAPLRIDEILGDDLEPVDCRPLAEDVREMDRAEADAETEVGMSETMIHVFFFAGAAPTFLSPSFIFSSKCLRAAPQTESMRGTWQLPLPLQSF